MFSLHLGEVGSDGIDGLRNDVVIQVGWSAERSVALRLNLRERRSNRVDERRQSQSGGLKTEALGG